MRNSASFFLSLAIICLAVSCDKDDRFGSGHDYLYLNQPSISLYDQMLLKGEVTAVRDSVVFDNGTSTYVERIEFGDYHLVKYFGANDVEFGTDSDSRCFAFQSISSSFACFEYPNKWQSTESIIETNGNKRIERAWDRFGKYTRMRIYDGETPVCAKEFAGESELEKYLYDANGFPKYTFTFDQDGILTVCTENIYEELESSGNACKIRVKPPNGSYPIHRKRKY